MEIKALWKLNFLQVITYLDLQVTSLTRPASFLGLFYMLQYMDKLALSQATLFHLQENLGRFLCLLRLLSPISSTLTRLSSTGPERPTVSLGICGVLLCLPGAGPALSHRSNPPWKVPAYIGVSLMCHVACKSFGRLMAAARFFLGVGVASIAPGFSLITGMFSEQEKQPARQAAWSHGELERSRSAR